MAIAESELDLGWCPMFDRWSHECFSVSRLPGEPTREEQRDTHVRCAGRPVADTAWYEIFAAASYYAIVVRVMNRSVARGEMPADQKIWLENPACLAQLLEERSGAFVESLTSWSTRQQTSPNRSLRLCSAASAASSGTSSGSEGPRQPARSALPLPS